jgi:hypothetical protein
MAKKKATPVRHASKAKTVQVENLGVPRVFGTNTPIALTIEKAQIETIAVELGKKSITIFAKNDFVPGIHPNQAAFVMNAVVGGAGSARGARQLGFALWVGENFGKFKNLGFAGKPEDYNVIVKYARRGGTMVYPMLDLISMCVTKAKIARNSVQRFPLPEDKTPARTEKTREAEVSLAL